MVGLAGAASLTASGNHTCAIDKAEDMRCWGNNASGQLAAAAGAPVTKPPQAASLRHVTAVALGADFSCAMTTESSVICWGSNRYGQLGDGTTKSRAAPRTVALE